MKIGCFRFSKPSTVWRLIFLPIAIFLIILSVLIHLCTLGMVSTRDCTDPIVEWTVDILL